MLSVCLPACFSSCLGFCVAVGGVDGYQTARVFLLETRREILGSTPTQKNSRQPPTNKPSPLAEQRKGAAQPHDRHCRMGDRAEAADGSCVQAVVSTRATLQHKASRAPERRAVCFYFWRPKMSPLSNTAFQRLIVLEGNNSSKIDNWGDFWRACSEPLRWVGFSGLFLSTRAAQRALVVLPTAATRHGVVGVSTCPLIIVVSCRPLTAVSWPRASGGARAGPKEGGRGLHPSVRIPPGPAER